jgi:cytochrome c-type biogenesis protein CcmH/NrfF
VRRLFAGALLAATLLALPAAAQQADVRDPGQVSQITMEISNQIYSPFCPGKTLVMCPSPGAAEVRQRIQVMAREGKTREEIKQDVLTTYGEQFRIVEPPPQDNILLAIAIGIGLILCITAVWAFSRKRKLGAGPAPDAPPDEPLSAEDADYLRALREEVQD